MQWLPDYIGLFPGFFGVTLALTGLSAAGALILGTLVAAMRVSPVPPLRWLGATYVRLVRNTPLTVVFVLVVFALPEIGIKLPFFRFAVLALTIYTATFVAEAVRSGINAVPVGQAEAARSVGLTFPQTLRIVVLPQAMRSVVPPLASIFIALLKNTSVAGGFGVTEALGGMLTLVNANPTQALRIMIMAAVGYVALALFFGWCFAWLERRLEIAR